MLRRESRGERLGSLIALSALPIVAIAIYAATAPARGHQSLQQIADEAALAGVLATSAHKTAAERDAATSVAVSRAVGDRQATIRAITPSADGLTVSVELIDPATRSEVTATARYVPPGAPRAEQKAAAISGHSGPDSHRF
ncbi:hypothetical protein [Rhodopseudomonas telluris]|uniref:Flp pilus-assembly TadG-like N-terminal domain-containing protein n=1 Tax=Rhodopseudomonas telluris TaxID=644215 RepID=A0ABV6EWD2_9BRAD